MNDTPLVDKIEVVKCPRCNDDLKFAVLKHKGILHLHCINCGEDLAGLIEDYGFSEVLK